MQGGWWYRGEYELTPELAGTRVTHRVFNVAKASRWAVPLANRFFIGFETADPRGVRAGLRGAGRLTLPPNENPSALINASISVPADP